MRLLFFILPFFCIAQIRYVDVNGGGDGTKRTSTWTLSEAFYNAIPGMHIYVKAGNYGELNLTLRAKGTEKNPIVFEGTDSFWTPIIAHNGSTFILGNTVDPKAMPLLKENRATNGTGKGVAITLDQVDYVHLKNFQIQYYERAVIENGFGNVMDNIVCIDQGNHNPKDTADKFRSFYKGKGITTYGNHVTIQNCYVQGAGAEGITFSGSQNAKSNFNKVVSANEVNATDYYFLIESGTKNGIFKNTTVIRAMENDHYGHGICFKGAESVTGNIVDGATIINTNLELQYPGVVDNEVRNFKIIRDSTIDKSSFDASGITLANGARANTFKNGYLENCMLKFRDWNDGLPGDVNESSSDNIFVNIVFNKGYAAIAFNYYGHENFSSSADNNKFYNCTFANNRYLFETSRANNGTVLINCIIDNVRFFSRNRNGTETSYPVFATYENCNFSRTGFRPPSGKSITTYFPSFKAIGSNGEQFELNKNSPLKRIGRDTKYNENLKGEKRVYGNFGIGAF